MGSLAEKKRRVLATSQERRGSRHVDDNSLHWKLYRYWVSCRGYQPAQENLCHYVRVVLIWAPLWWLRRLLFRRSVGISVAALVSVSVIVAAILTVKYWGWLAPTVAGVTGLVAYVAVGLAIGAFHIVEERTAARHFGWLYNRSKTAIILLTIPVLPVIVVAAAIILLLYLVSLVEDIPLGDILDWYIWRPLSSRTSWLTPLTATLAISFTTSGSLAWWFPLARDVFMIHLAALGLIILIIGLAFTAVHLEKYLTGRLLRKFFTFQKSTKTSNEESYEAWLEQLSKRLGVSTQQVYFSYGRVSRYAESYGLYTQTPQPAKQPRHVRAFKRVGHGLMAVINLLALLGSYLVALKRGTCPLIETPTK